MSLDQINLNELFKLYAEKNAYVREANLCGLIKLKNSYPDLFNSEKEAEIYQLLETTKYLINTPHFKAMLREDNKKKLIPLDHNQWKLGGLGSMLKQISKVNYSNIHAISREIVKEAIVICRILCEDQGKNIIDISTVFPFLGFLLTEILLQFSSEKRDKMFELALFKIRGKEEANVMDDAICVSDEHSEIFLQAECKIKNYFRDMLKIVLDKFDQRDEYYFDSLFFCLMNVAEFIGLLLPNIGIMKSENKYIAINRILINIVYK